MIPDYVKTSIENALKNLAKDAPNWGTKARAVLSAFQSSGNLDVFLGIVNPLLESSKNNSDLKSLLTALSVINFGNAKLKGEVLTYIQVLASNHAIHRLINNPLSDEAVLTVQARILALQQSHANEAGAGQDFDVNFDPSTSALSLKGGSSRQRFTMQINFDGYCQEMKRAYLGPINRDGVLESTFVLDPTKLANISAEEKQKNDHAAFLSSLKLEGATVVKVGAKSVGSFFDLNSVAQAFKAQEFPTQNIDEGLKAGLVTEFGSCPQVVFDLMTTTPEDPIYLAQCFSLRFPMGAFLDSFQKQVIEGFQIPDFNGNQKTYVLFEDPATKKPVACYNFGPEASTQKFIDVMARLKKFADTQHLDLKNLIQTSANLKEAVERSEKVVTARPDAATFRTARVSGAAAADTRSAEEPRLTPAQSSAGFVRHSAYGRRRTTTTAQAFIQVGASDRSLVEEPEKKQNPFQEDGAAP